MKTHTDNDDGYSDINMMLLYYIPSRNLIWRLKMGHLDFILVDLPILNCDYRDFPVRKLFVDKRVPAHPAPKNAPD